MYRFLKDNIRFLKDTQLFNAFQKLGFYLISIHIRKTV